MMCSTSVFDNPHVGMMSLLRVELAYFRSNESPLSPWHVIDATNAILANSGIAKISENL